MIPTIEEIIRMLRAGECTDDQALQWIGTHIDLASEDAALRDHFASTAAIARDGNGNLPEDSVLAVMGRTDPPVAASAAERLEWWCTAEARIRYAKSDAMCKARMV